MSKIETRVEAAAAGRTKYRTGKPCARGHRSPRYTTSGICCKCNSENAMVYQKKISKSLQGVVDETVRVSYRVHRDHVNVLDSYVKILNRDEE